LNTCRHALVTIVLICLALASAGPARAQQLSPALQAAVGHWQTINEHGVLKGHVETYLVGGKLFGKVTELPPNRPPDETCTKCSGELHNQRIRGMVIIRNFKPEGEVWAGGTVVDPENGKEYRGKIWSVGKDKLTLRGYVGIPLFGRSQTWKRLP
jgi:uncharacterized protein (DUF2147 family)